MGQMMNSEQALALWHDVLRETVKGEGPDLSSRQLAILLTIYIDPPPHTVRGLSTVLGVSKPAITRALDTLSGLDLLRRRRDETDRRNVLVQPTEKGTCFMNDFATLITNVSSKLPV